MSAPTFEVLAFRALPVTSGVAVLELEGRFSDRAPVRLGRPALLVEVGRDRFELLPVTGADAAAGPSGVPWRASFAVSAAALGRATFALEVGRDLLLDLPTPDLGAGDRDEGERLARLARESNDLRRRLDEAALRVEEAEAAAETARLETAAAVEKAAASGVVASEEASRSVEAVRAQSDLLLSEDRAEAQAALAAEQERHEREVEAVREQANHALATAEDEAEQAIAAVQARAESERIRHERELAAVREQADQSLATALREQKAELVPPPDGAAGSGGAGGSHASDAATASTGPTTGSDGVRSGADASHESDSATASTGPTTGIEGDRSGADGPANRGDATRDGPPDAAPQPADHAEATRGGPPDAAPQPAERVRPSTAGERLWRREPFVDDPGTAATEIVDTGNDETIRLLSGQRRPRHSVEDELEPATLAAPATRAGARSVGSTRASPSPGRREPQRIGALIALAVAIAAFVLVVVLRVGPF